MSAFKLGDVVRLKSGSPEMTVEDVGDERTILAGKVTCVWFPDRIGAPLKQVFLESSLLLVDEK